MQKTLIPADGRSLRDPPERNRNACQTGIIRTRFSAADFRLNRVIRLANTVKY